MSGLRKLIAEAKKAKKTKVFKPTGYHPFKRRKKCSHLKPGDPKDCECDNTHMIHNTVCDWCLRHGRKDDDSLGVVCPESGMASWNWNAER